MIRQVRVSAFDVLKAIHSYPLDCQRIPYPVRAILSAAGLDYDKIKSVDAGAIEASDEYAKFCFRFDKKELDRAYAQRPETRGWMVGGWWLNSGPMTNKKLKGLEFTVDLSRVEMEPVPPLKLIPMGNACSFEEPEHGDRVGMFSDVVGGL